MNILLNKKIRNIEQNVSLWIKSKITKKEIIYKIFDDVYSLLFNKNILPYGKDLIKSKIIIKDNSDEITYLAKVNFNCDSFFDCSAVNNFIIIFDKNFTTTKVAMTIGHELMHIYFHYISHLDKKLQDLDFEEGLCELIGFYVGLYIKTKGKQGFFNKETSKMLVKLKEEKLSGRNLDVYMKYNKFFLRAYEEFNQEEGNLLDYINIVLERRTLT